MEQKINNQLEASLDNNQFDDAQLVELKVPINLPYQTNWSDFQRCDGEIEIEGILYKYVKRKVANDTLYLMCIPNTKIMRLETVKNDLIKMSNGIMQNDNSQLPDNIKNISFKQLQSVYDDHFFFYNLLAPSQEVQTFLLTQSSPNLFSSPHLSPDQPPDLLKA